MNENALHNLRLPRFIRFPALTRAHALAGHRIKLAMTREG